MHILLAGEQCLVRDGLKVFLARLAPQVTVVEADGFDEALATGADAGKLDLIILDLAIPGMNGLEGLETMRERFPEAPVVVLSGSTDRRRVLAALARGAHGYIPKTLTGEAMLHALRLVISGEKYVPSVVISESQARQLREDGAGAYSAGNPLDSLTRRERDVLAVLVNGHSNREIARQLELKEVTVKVHLKGVFRKLGAANRTHAVRTALRLGLEG